MRAPRSSRGRSWREANIDALLAVMSDLGITMSRDDAGKLLDDRVASVATQMRVTPATARTYLTPDALEGLARSIAFELVEETPGADLMSAPRTVAVPLWFLGCVVAGLCEAQRIVMVESEDLEHTRNRISQMADIQSHLGLLLADQVATIATSDEPSVQMPRALLLRAARALDTAADLVESGLIGYGADPEDSTGLPSTFRRDASLLRSLGPADETSAGP